MSSPADSPALPETAILESRDGLRAWFGPGAGAVLDGLGLEPPSGASPGASPGSPQAGGDLLEALLARLYQLEPERWERRIPGRETFVWNSTRGALVVKRLRGGEARDYWSERLVGHPLRSAARREVENLLGLYDAGLPVPEPLLWIEERAARWSPGKGIGRSALVLAHVRHREHLGEHLSWCDERERSYWSARLARLVAQMHAAGWCHRDLYLEHFLLELGPWQRLVLIDAGRARREQPLSRRWIVKDLAALLHSCPVEVSRSERLRFLHGYLRERADPAAARAVAALARAAQRKARRLAAHEPRYAFDVRAQRGSGA